MTGIVLMMAQAAVTAPALPTVFELRPNIDYGNLLVETDAGKADREAGKRERETRRTPL